MGRAIGGFLLGMIGGGVLAIALAVAAAWLFDISQREGAYAMGVAFFWTPLGAIVGGILGAVVLVARRGRPAPPA